MRSSNTFGIQFVIRLGKQRQKVKDKIIWTFKLIEEVQHVPEIYLKHLEGTAGLFEIRVQSGNDISGYFASLTREISYTG